MTVLELSLQGGPTFGIPLSDAWVAVDADHADLTDRLVFAVSDAQARFVAGTTDDIDPSGIDGLERARWELEALADLALLVEHSLTSVPSHESVRAAAVDVIHPELQATVTLLTCWLARNDPDEWQSDRIVSDLARNVPEELLPLLVVEDLVTEDGVITLLSVQTPEPVEESLAMAITRPTDDVVLVLEARARGAQTWIVSEIAERIALTSGLNTENDDTDARDDSDDR